MKKILVLIIITNCLFACSTARKAVKTETLTQISTATADTSSLHATTARIDSTSTQSWEEMVVEWDSSVSVSDTEPDVTGKESTELTDFEKTLNALKKAGATKATIRKGNSTTTTTIMTTDSTAEKRNTTAQNVTAQTKEQTTIKKERSAWTFVMMYVFVTALLIGLVLGVKYLIKRFL